MKKLILKATIQKKAMDEEELDRKIDLCHRLQEQNGFESDWSSLM